MKKGTRLKGLWEYFVIFFFFFSMKARYVWRWQKPPWAFDRLTSKARYLLGRFRFKKTNKKMKKKKKRRRPLRTALYTVDIFIGDSFTCVVEDTFDSWTNASFLPEWKRKRESKKNNYIREIFFDFIQKFVSHSFFNSFSTKKHDSDFLLCDSHLSRACSR